MDKQEINTSDEYTIDLLQILKAIWKHAWMVAAAGIIGAVVGFCISNFTIAPTYSANVKLYVNNSSFSLGSASVSISPSQLSAAQSLVKTYGEILGSRSTLERIIDKAGLDCSWRTLSGMIQYGQLNGTEIMRVTVTCGDPYKASNIANTIAEVLPVRISEIIDGASMEVVDSAVPELNKIAPSITRYTMMGFLLGIMLIVGIIVIFVLLDDTVHDEEYIIKTYRYPILGRVPDISENSNKYYGYYGQKNQNAKQ
ncbi:MAG: hypothetical protein J6I50_06380 [Clostridia bacterium]|nr:hypothetical protein [Clostridia bacterium]